MENKSELRKHESDNAKGSSTLNKNAEGGNPQRGRSNSTKTQQSSGLRHGDRSSKSDVETNGGAPSRQTSDATNESGQL